MRIKLTALPLEYGRPISLITTLALTTHFGLASAQNKTLMQPTGIKNMTTNATSIILVHGGWGMMDLDGAK